jgi:hypothetical protein
MFTASMNAGAWAGLIGALLGSQGVFKRRFEHG